MPSAQEWVHHFEKNRTELLDIPWDVGPELGEDERALLSRSLAEFQRGESSEGRHLVNYAVAYARRTRDSDYPRAIKLFIAEEQRHARDLARFLTINGIALTGSSAADTVFRHLRKLLSTLEVSVAVLTLAEIIAQVYYRALRGATNSVILTRLCDQIIQDEDYHVQFQAEQLGRLRADRGALLHGLTLLAQLSLFVGTCCVVWYVHGQALRRGHYSLRRFWRDALRDFVRAVATSAAMRKACRDARREVRGVHVAWRARA